MTSLYIQCCGACGRERGLRSRGMAGGGRAHRVHCVTATSVLMLGSFHLSGDLVSLTESALPLIKFFWTIFLPVCLGGFIRIQPFESAFEVRNCFDSGGL